MNLQIATRQFADTVIAMPVGRIDHQSAAQFEAALAPLVAAAAAGRGALVLDFSWIDYISSVGLRVLMIAAKQMRECRRPFSSRHCKASLPRSSPSAGSTASLTVTATLEEAMALCSPPRSRSTGAPVLAYEDGAPPFDPLDHVARAPVDPAADVADRPVGQLGLALVVGMAERVAYVRVDGCNRVQLALRRRATLNTPADPA